jgi:5-methyltetrahydrofolate--homocysteine methyltransferase
MCDNELSELIRLIGLVMEHSDCGIMLDSPSPDVIKGAVAYAAGRPLILNSVTVTDRFEELVPLAVKTGASVAALPVDGCGIPGTLEKRLDNSRLLIERLRLCGMADEKIFLDVLAETVAVNSENAKLAIDTISALKKGFPQVNTTCGLSNISYGLPKRANINAAFLCAAIFAGLDSAIMDITSVPMRNALMSAGVIAGKDEYCMDYISYIREIEAQ